MALNEFSLIEKFFAPQTIARDDVILGIGDDAAIAAIPAHQQIVITTDTLIAGVHFPENTSAYDIGFKALAVNLSDLAAMGATPAWVTLALTLPKADETWLTEFSRGFFALASQFNIQLIGGDLTRGPLVITVGAYGFIAKDQAILRSGAIPGDLIYVTNTLGDAALALRSPNPQKELLMRLNRPTPRIEIGEKLRKIAHAAIDISDGLAADLQHILEKSHVGARINLNQLPLSEALRQSVPSDQAIALALNGGDDYELCFTIPKEKQQSLEKMSTQCKVTCTLIGEITNSLKLDLRFQDGSKYNQPTEGYKHF